MAIFRGAVGLAAGFYFVSRGSLPQTQTSEGCGATGVAHVAPHFCGILSWREPPLPCGRTCHSNLHILRGCWEGNAIVTASLLWMWRREQGCCWAVWPLRWLKRARRYGTLLLQNLLEAPRRDGCEPPAQGAGGVEWCREGKEIAGRRQSYCASWRRWRGSGGERLAVGFGTCDEYEWRGERDCSPRVRLCCVRSVV